MVFNFSSIFGKKLRKNWFPIFSQFFLRGKSKIGPKIENERNFFENEKNLIQNERNLIEDDRDAIENERNLIEDEGDSIEKKMN